MDSKQVLLTIFLIFNLFLICVLPANILFYFPAANFSQKNSIWPLVLALAQNGHNVTFLSPQSKAPTKHQNITDLFPIPLQDMVAPLYKIDRFAIREAGLEKNFNYVDISVTICKAVIEQRDTDSQLVNLFSADSKFDLVIINSLLSECGFYVAKYFNAKTIHFSPATLPPFYYETYGINNEAAWIPDYLYKFENVPMTFWDRAFNALMPVYWQWVRNYQMSPRFQTVAKSLLKTENVPTLYELEQEVSILMVNSHVSADFARTMPPLLVDVGGMTNWDKEKPIPKQFMDFMDTATNGVVLITFGSTVLLNQVSKKHQSMFFHLISRFPQIRFLMRWQGPLPDFLKSSPENLMVSEWLPQQEILRHPNVIAFMTHGGISSIHEATYHGVPIIVLPLFSDQDYNAYRVEAQGVGVRVEIRGMTENTLVTALVKILAHKKFKDNMMRKSAIFKDRPQSPVETAVFWTEFALRHNDTIRTFRPQNQHLNFLQIRLADVHVFDCICVIIVLCLAAKLVRCSINSFSGIIQTLTFKTKVE